MATVVSFEAHKAQKFIEKGLLLSYGDPPDSDYQRGDRLAWRVYMPSA